MAGKYDSPVHPSRAKKSANQAASSCAFPLAGAAIAKPTAGTHRVTHLLTQL
jgi:hypothetical protein